MKIFVFILAVCFSANLYARQEIADSNHVYWSEGYKLTWDDFEKQPDQFLQYGAYSFTGFKAQYDFTLTYYKATITAFFNKELSWRRSKIMLLLQHEQGHFNLTELYSRIYRKRVKEEMEAGTLTVERFTELSEEIEQSLREAQEEYDEATNYSLDLRAQLRWNELIVERLQEYAEYSNPEVIVKKKTDSH